MRLPQHEIRPNRLLWLPGSPARVARFLPPVPVLPICATGREPMTRHL